MNPGIDYRRIYQSSRDLGSYVLELRSVLVKNIRFKMAKEGLDNTEFKNDYVENMMRATESILFMMQTDISDNDNELISFENEKFKQTLEKYTDILSKLYGTDFRKKCVATVLTVYGIETRKLIGLNFVGLISCNSAYRLRY